MLGCKKYHTVLCESLCSLFPLKSGRASPHRSPQDCTGMASWVLWASWQSCFLWRDPLGLRESVISRGNVKQPEQVKRAVWRRSSYGYGTQKKKLNTLCTSQYIYIREWVFSIGTVLTLYPIFYLTKACFSECSSPTTSIPLTKGQNIAVFSLITQCASLSSLLRTPLKFLARLSNVQFS